MLKQSLFFTFSSFLVAGVAYAEYAPAPTYTIGDRYEYTCEKRECQIVWTVAAVDDKTVTFTAGVNQDREFTMYRIYVGRSAKWDERPREDDWGTAEIEGDLTPLFPLTPGKKIVFTRKTTEAAGDFTQKTQCTVNDMTSLTVPAGTFSVYPIACVINDRRTITFHHSPAVGFYVRSEDIRPNRDPVIRELTKFSKAQ
jgi:hypothetical protein